MPIFVVCLLSTNKVARVGKRDEKEFFEKRLNFVYITASYRGKNHVKHQRQWYDERWDGKSLKFPSHSLHIQSTDKTEIPSFIILSSGREVDCLSCVNNNSLMLLYSSAKTTACRWRCFDERKQRCARKKYQQTLKITFLTHFAGSTLKIDKIPYVWFIWKNKSKNLFFLLNWDDG